MKFNSTAIEGVYIIDLEIRSDYRGGFARTFCQKEFAEVGFDKSFVQINHSYNPIKGTLRGMHFQYPPYQESKLIRCVRGKVIDVAIDIRKGSPTFLEHIKVELSEMNKRMILIPEGCAHGFQTLENNSDLIYHHTASYVPNSDGGLRYDDTRLGIDWELTVSRISEKDKTFPLLNNKFVGI